MRSRFPIRLVSTSLAGGGTARRPIRFGILAQISSSQTDLLRPQHQLQRQRQLLLHLPAHHLARVTMCAFSVSATISLATARWTGTLASSSAQSLPLMLWWCEHPSPVKNLENGIATSYGLFCLKFLFLFIIAASRAMFLDCGASVH